MDAPVPVDNKTATAILQYKGVPTTILPLLPRLPTLNDTDFAGAYLDKLRSLNTPQFPANVPLTVDRRLFYTIGLGMNPCASCVNGTRLTASLNNITFVMPTIGLLQAHYFGIKGVFRLDFPDKPVTAFNYTGAPLTANLGTSKGTRLSKVAFNSSVELVLQDTNLLTVESHPFHLHGYNFFVVGRGIGNFDPAKDPAKFNLVDPPERNTVGVPTGGWTAIRFRADNPGGAAAGRRRADEDQRPGGSWWRRSGLAVGRGQGSRVLWRLRKGELGGFKGTAPAKIGDRRGCRLRWGRSSAAVWASRLGSAESGEESGLQEEEAAKKRRALEQLQQQSRPNSLTKPSSSALDDDSRHHRSRDRELEAIREQYLGFKKPKKCVIKPNEKFRFSLDWENTEDTSRDMNVLYQNPHEARLLFGRGFRAGMDRREQKKLAACNEKEILGFVFP
ncbi:hypothetical protein J5N97_000703 [Dioscorea zingiberensis]|uniref:Plastocyanin-like domain-containing protein n=1 Tax=Dioscorea zingiberensis TaxID=325984 RepID=A0A9D5BUX9_9LILI|nr:hypothetical protein J5N97_000703 [Dioscorea zingiberensis]